MYAVILTLVSKASSTSFTFSTVNPSKSTVDKKRESRKEWKPNSRWLIKTIEYHLLTFIIVERSLAKRLNSDNDTRIIRLKIDLNLLDGRRLKKKKEKKEEEKRQWCWNDNINRHIVNHEHLQFQVWYVNHYKFSIFTVIIMLGLSGACYIDVSVNADWRENTCCRNWKPMDW